MGLKQLLSGRRERALARAANSPLAVMPDAFGMQNMGVLLIEAGARARASRIRVSAPEMSHRRVRIWNRGSLSVPGMGFSAQGLTVVSIKETKVVGRSLDTEW